MISLIVSHYKNIPALSLVMQSLTWQKDKNFELIIAEDDDSEECKVFVAEALKKYTFPIKHVWHVKDGFSKCKILNKAVEVSAFEKLVFIDGDCILHPNFIAVYNKVITENEYYYGRRVWLTESISQKLYTTGNLKLLSLCNLIRHKVPNITASFVLPFRPSFKKSNPEIWGCNWGILKKYVTGVNGFDEDYNKTGYGVDLDIAWRLRKKYDLQLISLKNKAIQYHLYHPMNNIPSASKEMYERKIAEGFAECKNGIQKM